MSLFCNYVPYCNTPWDDPLLMTIVVCITGLALLAAIAGGQEQ